MTDGDHTTQTPEEKKYDPPGDNQDYPGGDQAQSHDHNMKDPQPKTNVFDQAEEYSFDPLKMADDLASEEKEDYGFSGESDQSPHDSVDSDGDTEPQAEDGQQPDVGSRVRKAYAKMYAKMTNTLIPALMSINTGNDFTEYQASKNETTEIADAFDEFMKEAGYIKPPPWMQLAMALPVVYLPKFVQSSKDRKNKKNAERVRAKKKAQSQQDPDSPVAKASFDSDIVDVEHLPDDRDENGFNLSRSCEYCSKPLKPNQKRFCSRSCNNQYQKEFHKK